jgi:hypothetical protein
VRALCPAKRGPDQPRSPEKAGSLGNASFARRGSKLDESAVAAKRYPRTFERLAHEKRAHRSGRSRKGAQVDIRQSLTLLRDAPARPVVLRRIK